MARKNKYVKIKRKSNLVILVLRYLSTLREMGKFVERSRLGVRLLSQKQPNKAEAAYLRRIFNLFLTC